MVNYYRVVQGANDYVHFRNMLYVCVWVWVWACGCACVCAYVPAGCTYFGTINVAHMSTKQKPAGVGQFSVLCLGL